MNYTPFRHCVVLMLLVMGFFFVRPVYAAITCSNMSINSVTFGNVDPQSSQTDVTATLTYTCRSSRLSSLFYDSATLCFNIGEPAGGPTNPRQMEDSFSNTLNFQLYQNPARSLVWGSQFFGSPTPLMVNITLPGGFGGGSPVTYSNTVYGRVMAGQSTTIPGSYTNNYGPNDTSLTINSVSGQTPPGYCSGSGGTSFGSFLVSANVVKKCTVTASTLNFGNVGLLNSAVSASTSLGVQCSRTTPYNVGLSAGLNSGGNINARQMVLGTNSINYQLYRDATRTQVWGNTIGSNTVAGIGTGNTQNLNVYGTVPVQGTPAAGTYNDTIVVTVTY